MRRTTAALLAILAINALPTFGQPASPGMRSVPTGDGGFILYETSGSPDGEAVLTIHGGAVAAAFLPLMEQPALSDYYLIRYHRRGFGGSSDRDGEGDRGGREIEAADALALLDHLNVTKAHVVAHSAGGPIALELARSYPDRVQSVILLEAQAPDTLSSRLAREGLTPQEWEARVEGFRNMPLERRAPGYYDGLLESFYGENWRNELERFIPGALEQANSDLQNVWVTGMSTRPPVPDDFYGGLRQPVLFVLSDTPDDSYWNFIQNLAESPNVSIRRAVDVPNHAFQFRFPEPTAREIATWLSRNGF